MFYARHRFSITAMALVVLLAMPAPMLAQDFSPLTPEQTQQVPEPAEGGVNWGGVGWGALSLLANIPYIPAKMLYALTGSLVGAGAWAVTGGNTQVANTVWRSFARRRLRRDAGHVGGHSADQLHRSDLDCSGARKSCFGDRVIGFVRRGRRVIFAGDAHATGCDRSGDRADEQSNRPQYRVTGASR